jgi:hypothetical protein
MPKEDLVKLGERCGGDLRNGMESLQLLLGAMGGGNSSSEQVGKPKKRRKKEPIVWKALAPVEEEELSLSFLPESIRAARRATTAEALLDDDGDADVALKTGRAGGKTMTATVFCTKWEYSASLSSSSVRLSPRFFSSLFSLHLLFLSLASGCKCNLILVQLAFCRKCTFSPICYSLLQVPVLSHEMLGCRCFTALRNFSTTKGRRRPMPTLCYKTPSCPSTAGNFCSERVELGEPTKKGQVYNKHT